MFEGTNITREANVHDRRCRLPLPLERRRGRQWDRDEMGAARAGSFLVPAGGLGC